MNRQYNGQKKKYKQRSTKYKHKTKDRVTRTPLKPGVNSGVPEECSAFVRGFLLLACLFTRFAFPVFC